MPRSHPPYPSEFRAEAVKLYHTSGKSLQEVAADLGVTANLLREWVRRAEVEDGSREGLTQDEREELSRLFYMVQGAFRTRISHVFEAGFYHVEHDE